MLTTHYGTLREPRQVLRWPKNFIVCLDPKTGIAIIAHNLVVFDPIITAVFRAMDMVAIEVKQVVVGVTVAAADTAA